MSDTQSTTQVSEVQNDIRSKIGNGAYVHVSNMAQVLLVLSVFQQEGYPFFSEVFDIATSPAAACEEPIVILSEGTTSVEDAVGIEFMEAELGMPEADLYEIPLADIKLLAELI